MSTKWTGSIFDLQAKEAKVELELPDEVVKPKERKGSIQGIFRIFFGINFEKPEFEAPLSITVKGKEVRFEYKADTKLGSISFEFNGEITDADPFAKNAIFGSYKASSGRTSAFFKGGSMIIWLFAGAEKIEA
jgi:hypothetical protein